MRAQRVDQGQQMLQHRLTLQQNLAIVIADHPYPLPLEPMVSPGITQSPLPIVMLTAIDLDHQPDRRRPEIRNEWPQRTLPVKLHSTQLPAANPLP